VENGLIYGKFNKNIEKGERFFGKVNTKGSE